MALPDTPRAAPPQAPAPTRPLLRARVEQRSYRAEREVVVHRSRVRGLVLLAIIVLVASIARAGVERVFVQGWWRHW